MHLSIVNMALIQKKSNRFVLAATDLYANALVLCAHTHRVNETVQGMHISYTAEVICRHETLQRITRINVSFFTFVKEKGGTKET